MLKDLGCLESYYPIVSSGTAQQHIVLDAVGAKILHLTYWNKMAKLPITYRHRVLVNEYLYKAKQYGLPEPSLEHYIGTDKDGIKADIYYLDKGIAVEIDTGSETYRQLESKARRYKKLDVSTVVMLTEGPRARLDAFFGVLGSGIGAQFDAVDKVLLKLKGAKL